MYAAADGGVKKAARKAAAAFAAGRPPGAEVYLDHLRPTHVHSVDFGTARCLFRKQPMPVAVNQDPVTRAHARKADGRFLFRIQLYQLHPLKAYQRGKAHKVLLLHRVGQRYALFHVAS